MEVYHQSSGSFYLHNSFDVGQQPVNLFGIGGGLRELFQGIAYALAPNTNTCVSDYFEQSLSLAICTPSFIQDACPKDDYVVRSFSMFYRNSLKGFPWHG